MKKSYEQIVKDLQRENMRFFVKYMLKDYLEISC